MTLEEIKEQYSMVEMETGIYCGKLVANNATSVKLDDAVFRRDLDGVLSKAKYMGDVSIPASRVYFIVKEIHEKRTAMMVRAVLEEAGVI